MSLFGVDIKVWLGLVVAASGIVGGVRAYLRSRSQDMRLAIAYLMLGVAWSLVALLAVCRLSQGTEGFVLASFLFGLGMLICIGYFVLIFWPPPKKRDG